MAGPEISGDKVEKIIGDKTLHVAGMWSPRFRGADDRYVRPRRWITPRSGGGRQAGPAEPAACRDVVAPISGGGRQAGLVLFEIDGCGRTDFRTTAGAAGASGMWSPRFRGADDSDWRPDAGRSPRADDRGTGGTEIHTDGCGRPDFGGRTTGGRRPASTCGRPDFGGRTTGRARRRDRDVVAPISGGGRQGVAPGEPLAQMWSPRFGGRQAGSGCYLACAGCGRPDFGGRTTGRQGNGGRPRMWSPRFRGRTTGLRHPHAPLLRMWSPRFRGADDRDFIMVGTDWPDAPRFRGRTAGRRS